MVLTFIFDIGKDVVGQKLIEVFTAKDPAVCVRGDPEDPRKDGCSYSHASGAQHQENFPGKSSIKLTTYTVLSHPVERRHFIETSGGSPAE